MTENELSKLAVDVAYTIHKALGPGLLESVYEEAFTYELRKRGVPYQCQQEIPVWYDGVKLGRGFRADIVMDNKLLIELKSVEALDKVHFKILLNYLKLSGIKLGLLINFNVELIREGIYRKLNGQLD